MKIGLLKIVFSLFLFSFSLFASFGQTNLVPNPSFEIYDTCPNTSAQLDYCNNWFPCQGSTDYFNSCDNTNFVSVPYNFHGFQNAFDGNGYIGMYSYDKVVKTYREPAVASLTQPLLIGQKYFVSFKVVLTLDSFASCCATNKIGVLFSTIPFSASNPPPISNFAHIYTDTIISDTLNWKIISGSFIADSAYTYVSIGTFFDSLNIQLVDFVNYYASTGSYYFVDDVRISTDSEFVMSSNRADLNKQIVKLFPNPSEGFLNIKIPDSNSLLEIEIDNLFGQRVFTGSVSTNERIDVQYLNDGIYTVTVKKNKIYICSLSLIILKK